MKRVFLLLVAAAAVALVLLTQIEGPNDAPPKSAANSPPASPFAAGEIELVLAASWQPGFCATSAGRNKAECRSLTAARPDATRFSIHGLWPDDLDDAAIYPCFCDDGGPLDCGARRPAQRDVAVSAPVMARLEALMPGVRSGLHRHEWTKHGSCYEDDLTGSDRDADPDEYFTETMALVEALNASAVRDLFAAHLGRTLTRDAIRDTFDDAFGRGAGARVAVVCAPAEGRDVITELRVNLGAGVTAAPDLGALIHAAPAASGPDQGCAAGLVARARN